MSALGSSMNKSKILLIPSFDSLSPNLSLIASTKSSNEIPPFLSASGVSKSAISWYMVGFLLSKPNDCMAAFSSFGSILPVPFVSNKSKACLISSTSSLDKPGLSTFLDPPLLLIFLYYIYFYDINFY